MCPKNATSLQVNAHFVGFILRLALPRWSKKLSQISHVVLKGLTNDNDVIQVHEATAPLQSCHYRVHRPLEGRWGIT